MLNLLLLFQHLDTDVAIPYFIAMILEAEVSLVAITTAVLQQLECQRPCLLAELAALQKLDPLLAPKLIAQYLHTILEVSHLAVLHLNANLVPLASRIGILWFGNNHVVE